MDETCKHPASLPVGLEFVRDLEAFEGTILAEYRAGDGSVYLQKWCANGPDTTHWLYVRTTAQAVEDYLEGKVSMRNLLLQDDGVGLAADFSRASPWVGEVWRVRLLDLPGYLPKPGRFHDPDLRPEE